jgi:hypothetical protein
MDPASTAVLGSVGFIIHLYAPRFYRPFHYPVTYLGNSLGISLQEE